MPRRKGWRLPRISLPQGHNLTNSYENPKGGRRPGFPPPQAVKPNIMITRGGKSLGSGAAQMIDSRLVLLQWFPDHAGVALERAWFPLLRPSRVTPGEVSERIPMWVEQRRRRGQGDS